MVLSDKTLKKMIAEGKLIKNKIGPNAIQPASIDCTLGNKFLLVDSSQMTSLSLDDEIIYREIEADEITIPANSFILATTNEYMLLPDDIVCFVEGRSSIGRLGLFIQNAGWVDPGFEGKITLELYNANSLPIKLTAGRRICQFVFAKTDFPVELPYGAPGKKSKYQGQDTTVGSRVFRDEESRFE